MLRDTSTLKQVNGLGRGENCKRSCIIGIIKTEFKVEIG
jgi:hypothetical protein